MDPPLHLNQNVFFYTPQTHWNETVTDTLVKELVKLVRTNYVGESLLDFVDPVTYLFVTKSLNDHYGAYHTYTVEECKESVQSLFDRYRCFGFLLSRGCVTWNKNNNEVIITKQAEFNAVAIVSNYHYICNLCIWKT